MKPQIDAGDCEHNKSMRAYKISDRRIIIAGVCFLVMVICVIFLLSPFFKIEKIKITGSVDQEIYSQVAGKCNKYKGKNILSVNSDNVEAEISSVERIDSVEVIRDFPDMLEVRVSGSDECAYIKLEKEYVGINREGKILIRTHNTRIKAPVISGVKLINPQTGQYIKIDAPDAGVRSELISKILKESFNQGITGEIKTIDITDMKDIHMILNSDILVNFGKDGEQQDDSIEYKIAFLKAIIPSLGNQKGGVIELSDTDNVTSRAS